MKEVRYLQLRPALEIERGLEERLGPDKWRSCD